MSELLQAFLLGNSAILTNVCVLPLYPGLIAFLAGNAQNERAQRATKWLGLLVLLGVLTLMTVVGLLLYLLQQSFDKILPVLLPIIYGIVIVMGLLMLFGWNPFNRLTVSQSPTLQNPYAAAFVYGLLLGPMTLPCTGPLIVSAFLLGAGSFANLSGSLAYFFAFGLGFGWPLVLLPFIATTFQKRFTRWMTQNYKLLTRLSGILLIGIGLLGIFADLLPNL
ncbi:MAG: sulfite exporter TauE/SafE family protein [Ardenticatenaceae bacterium]|nr:sulfite exporter TauE/SafE family protein [Ardenticatenaceae bacterium]